MSANSETVNKESLIAMIDAWHIEKSVKAKEVKKQFSRLDKEVSKSKVYDSKIANSVKYCQGKPIVKDVMPCIV